MPIREMPDDEPFRRAALSRTSAKAAEQTVYIELGDSAQKPLISRNGAPVPIIKTVPDKIGGIIAGGEDIVFKVLAQSVAPGTAVPKGTAVDLVLASPFNIPLEVFDGVHADLADKAVHQVFDDFIRNDPDVRNVLARNETFDRLTETDKTVIARKAQTLGVVVNDQPGTNLGNLFGALQAANTFGEKA